MCDAVELAAHLPLGDGLGVQDHGLALLVHLVGVQFVEGGLQDLVAPRLTAAGWANKHHAVAHQRHGVQQLDDLVDEKLGDRLADGSVKRAVVDLRLGNP